MLVIRDSQMRVLGRSLQNELSQRIAEHLRAEYAHWVARFDDHRLLKAVDAARQRAVAYGFERQSSVLAFVALVFTVGARFDRQPRIYQILSEQHVPADSRIAYLADAISDDEWDEARWIDAE